jgi:hypothetical protein
VPAFNACDIASTQHDRRVRPHDRVCSYATLTALIETRNPAKTAVAVLIDKRKSAPRA